MRLRDVAILSAVAGFGLTSTAFAADMHVPAPVGYGACPPPAVKARTQPPERDLPTALFQRRNTWVQPPRVVTVEPFHGTTPGAPKYVPAQPAYLASSECPPSLGHSPGGSWYDGKVFYYNGTTPQRPDMFKVIVEPSKIRRPLSLGLF